MPEYDGILSPQKNKLLAMKEDRSYQLTSLKTVALNLYFIEFDESVSGVRRRLRLTQALQQCMCFPMIAHTTKSGLGSVRSTRFTKLTDSSWK